MSRPAIREALAYLAMGIVIGAFLFMLFGPDFAYAGEPPTADHEGVTAAYGGGHTLPPPTPPTTGTTVAPPVHLPVTGASTAPWIADGALTAAVGVGVVLGARWGRSHLRRAQR